MLFQDERFGMFIHWGLYSIHGWHEQEQWRKNIAKEEYETLVKQFDPKEFCIDEWLELVKEAGMEYICFTTKHHDGFCMWDTKYTEYNIMNTPYHKDILREVADGCARHGIKLALYYSCPDWHYKHSVNFGGDHQLARPNPGDEPNEELYKEYIRNQMTELLGNYGKIDALFWDIPPYNRDESMNAFVRGLQPGILINNRGYSEGDYSTPERSVPSGSCFTRLTEACQSVSAASWGYRADDDYYSNLFLMQSIDNIMCRGGNCLLNVGPDALGRIPKESAEKIRTVGNWYRKVRESYQKAEWIHHPDIPCRMTVRDRYLYLHFDGVAVSSGFSLRPLNLVPRSAIVLNTGEEIAAKVEYLPYNFTAPGAPMPEYLHINRIPVDELTKELIVLRLEFEDVESVKAILNNNVRGGDLLL